jgi:hypothetical protein
MVYSSGSISFAASSSNLLSHVEDEFRGYFFSGISEVRKIITDTFLGDLNTLKLRHDTCTGTELLVSSQDFA